MSGVSLRLVIALLISFASMISILIAFIPTYLSGVAAVRSTLSDLREAYVGRAGEGIDAFFQVPIASLAEVHNAISHGMLNLTDEPTWVKWMSNYSTHYPDRVSVVAKRLWTRSGEDYATYSSLDLRYGSSLAIYIKNNLTHFITSRYDQAKLEIAFKLSEVVYSQDTMSEPEIATRMNPTETVFWSHLYAGVETPSLAAIIVLPDEVNPGAARGYISVEILPANLDTFFQSIHLRGGARAVVLDSATKVMLGNSWGEVAAEILPARDDYFAPGYLRIKMKTLANLSDTTILETVQEIGADHILTGEVPYAVDLYEGHALTYVNVLEVTGPSLKLRLLLVMPEIDFMEEVYNTQILTIGVVSSTTVALIVGAMIVAHLLTRPLVDLRERMELTASLQDTDDDGSLSGFSEVANMQNAYRQMKMELNRMKSYLPQSVLFPNQDDDDDEEMSRIGNESGASNISGGSGAFGLENSQPQSALEASRLTVLELSNNSRSFGKASDTQSKRSRKVSLPYVVEVGLNTGGGVLNKRVSIIAFNIRAFHHVATKGAASVTKLQTSYLEVIQRVTQLNKGVVDVFQGDHVTCSFNAVGNCPASIRRSALVALQVVETLKDECEVAAGVANGHALVGNMGTDQMRRFCIVGPVVPQAMALERLTKWYTAGKVRIMMSNSMLDDIQHELQFVIVDRIKLPGQRNPELVAALLEKKAAVAENEWMYQLNDGEHCPFQLLHDAWNSIPNGALAVNTKVADVDRELQSKPEPQTGERLSSPSVPRKSSVRKADLMPPFNCDVINASTLALSSLVTEHEGKESWDIDAVYNNPANYYERCLI